MLCRNVISLMLTFLPALCFAANPITIGIAGGSGSGKTTLAQTLASSLSAHVVLIEEDCYYKDLSHLPATERAKTNFDHPDSIDFDRFCHDIALLRKGQPIQKPIYDFKTHTRKKETKLVQPADIIIVEGILVLAEEKMRDLCDLKVYVKTDDDLRLLRRIERDINERGRDFASVQQQYLLTVKPMHMQFVEPTKQYADVIIPGGADTSAVVNLILGGLREHVRTKPDASQ